MSNSITITIDVDKMEKFFNSDPDYGTILAPFDADPFGAINAPDAVKETPDAFIIKFLKNENYNFKTIAKSGQFQYLYLKFVQLTEATNFTQWDEIFTDLSTSDHYVNEKFELIIPSVDFNFKVGSPEQKNNLIYSIVFSFVDNNGNLKWGSLDPLIDIKNIDDK